MLQFVHHVQYLVRSRDAMVAYMEKNFGMKPDFLGVNKNGNEARYDLAQTQIQFTEPTDPNSAMWQQLAKNGPGVFHVAWGVNNIRERAQELAAKGTQMQSRREGKEFASKNPDGVFICNIEPASSEGVWFQLAEG